MDRMSNQYMDMRLGESSEMHVASCGTVLALGSCQRAGGAAPSLEEHLGAAAAELGATGSGAEVAAMSTPNQRSGKYLGAMTHGAETCYLGAMSHGADPLGLKTQFVLPRVYL